ncbi:glycosyltransferase family 2 protein [Nocardioides zeae]|uniref:Glycosyltransferase family 2 protein n=1 Tax=Nocardioides imazamoxiresistens TaxID=3231893 RepID=A0ABU3PZV7_9ACTN|nr:glycosyltransferase family 2 protein [Nocardioides zeae]MDT9594803.1 glycosyltransferase family 2 protein [Nocardioides zeae]
MSTEHPTTSATTTDPEGEPTMTAPQRRRVAYVLPVYDEQDNVATFQAALAEATARRDDLDFEFVYVDDGSRDASLERLLALRAADERVTVLALSRNHGHQLAVTAGLDAVTGSADAVVVMDTDLQDPPAVSLELIEVWERGVDVVYAQRRTRRDSAFKRATAWLFYWLLARLAEIEIPRNTGDFRLMDARVVAEVGRYREHNRFLRGIVAQVGFRQEAVLFDRDERLAGSTGYPLRKMLSFAGHGIMGFSTTPLRMISRAGILISVLSVLGAVYVVFLRFFRPDEVVPGWAFIMVALFLLSGLQLIMMGVIGSYLGRVFVEVQGRPLYSVALAARGHGAPRDEPSDRPVDRPSGHPSDQPRRAVR